MEGEECVEGACLCNNQTGCSTESADVCTDGGCLCGANPVCTNKNTCIESNCLCGNSDEECAGETFCKNNACVCFGNTVCMSGEECLNQECTCSYNNNATGCDPDISNSCEEGGCFCGASLPCTNGNTCVDGACACGNNLPCDEKSRCDSETGECLFCLTGEGVLHNQCSCNYAEGGACDQTTSDECMAGGCLCDGIRCLNNNMCVEGVCTCGDEGACIGSSWCDRENGLCVCGDNDACLTRETCVNSDCSCYYTDEGEGCNSIASDSCDEEGCRCGSGASCTNNNFCINGICQCTWDSQRCTGNDFCDQVKRSCVPLNCVEGEIIVGDQCACLSSLGTESCDSNVSDLCNCESGCMCGTGKTCLRTEICLNGVCYSLEDPTINV